MATRHSPNRDILKEMNPFGGFRCLMTAQMHDLFLIGDEIFSIVGLKGDHFFEPRQNVGVMAMGNCSACWRGYRGTFATDENTHLVLRHLQIDPAIHPQIPIADDIALVEGIPILQGVHPKKLDDLFESCCGQYYYENLNLPLPYSGGVLIAQGFIRELYVHMGFHPAWKYETVYELIFDKGGLEEERNVSAAMAQIRQRLSETPLRPDYTADEDEIKRWIDGSFRLDYDF